MTNVIILKVLRSFNKPIPIGFLAEQTGHSYPETCKILNNLIRSGIPMTINGNSVQLKE